ncbi:MAG: VWA domain-containing protein [Melioribacteraceae bacterium]
MIRPVYRLLWIILIPLLVARCTFDDQVANSSTAGAIYLKPAFPLNNSIDQSVIQTFKWESENVLSYDLYLDKVNPPLKIVASGIPSKSYVYPFPLEYNSTYYWRVGANYPDGTKKVSPVQIFRTTANFNPASSGYALYLKSKSTELPNLVHFLFQVVDLNNNTVPSLQTGDFEFFEDGFPIQSESLIEIKKQDQLPYKIRTVLMLDNSTSLTDTELGNVRNAVTSFIGKIKPNQEVAIYQFSESVEILSDFTNLKDSLYNSINRYRSGKSTTGLYSAAVKGASLWQDKYSVNDALQGTMIIFTDGNETSRPTTEALSEALSAVSNKFVFTIGLRGKDPLDEETLMRLGTAGFYGINFADQLESQFTLIQKTIYDYANSFYQLNYKSPRRGGGEYTLTIRVKGNTYNGNDSYILGSYSSSGFFSKRGNN